MINEEQPRKYRKVGSSSNDVEEPTVDINVHDRRMFQMKENFGVWWPEAQWNAAHPTMKADKKELVSLPGRSAGVIKDEKYGRPIGTIDLSMVDVKEVEKLTYLHTSDKDIREGSNKIHRSHPPIDSIEDFAE